jgi:RNA polymerase sigma factor (sigma-70 family)
VSEGGVKRWLEAFLRSRSTLERVATSYTKNGTVAEDIVQDIWIKLDSAEPVDEIDSPSRYMTRVVRNAALDQFRKERRQSAIRDEVTDLIWEPRDDISPERIAMGRDELRRVEAVLASLPEKTRKIFLMNRIEGVSHRKIAEQMAISEEAVYYHIRRALERLVDLRDQRNL